MKLLHGAALALFGWYLMLPPPDTTAPFANWKIEGSFDSAAQCKAALDSLIAQEAQYPPDPNPDNEAVWRKALQDALCIATDDPRLKGN